MDRRRAARLWHTATAAVGGFALIAQLILVVIGISVLVEEDPPSLGQRLLRFVSYFTVQANVIVWLAVVALARNPSRDGRKWRVLRLAGLTGIIITGLVHWFWLRPLLTLTGWSYLTDKLLHVVVPLMAVVGWVAFGPRPRVNLRIVLLGLIWPTAWLVYTLVMGALTGWYPYPFVNVDVLGGRAVGLACGAIAVGFFAVSALVWLIDRVGGRVLDRAPAP